MANVMTAAGVQTKDESRLLIALVWLFLISSTAYPVTYIYSIIYYWRKRKSSLNPWKLLSPIVHIVIVILLGFLWSLTGSG
ncbi:hypothetical protein [Paenibacillus lacisoli]|uniref:hypothetical protein n=1 Tax=Paenibacillus lacisoli TaxID=3064525 RepID=UPI00272CE405|nr:hypothetical protein [Paenibacillus sp. JX-17]